jgi:hypothetical protein
VTWDPDFEGSPGRPEPEEKEAMGAILRHAETVTKRWDGPENPHGEMRHTSESGGQKGRKPEIYRLIPAPFYAEVHYNTPLDLVADIRNLTGAFWNGSGASLLAAAARIAEAAMGGPVAARYHIARVYGLGAIKYSDDNWRKGYPYSWSYDALRRHLEAIERGELMDETGVPHWANIWWHCATLWTYVTENLGTDDRPAKKEVR